MVATKAKVCTRKVRQAGVHVKCDTSYIGDRCPNSDNHLVSMKTGFCSNGWHEGSKATDWRGNPVPTCKMTITCPCECHDQLDKLFAMTERERIVVDSSGYMPPERTYWMPSDDPMPILSNSSDLPAPVRVESEAPDLVPARIDRAFAPTPTGRAARGELESWVRIETDAWIIDQPGEPCTLSYLAESIARAQGITPPSVGAILAVLQRWEKLGFAVIAKKPNRFVGYTPDGKTLGLEVMKARAKRAKKQSEANLRRGIR